MVNCSNFNFPSLRSLQSLQWKLSIVTIVTIVTIVAFVKLASGDQKQAPLPLAKDTLHTYAQVLVQEAAYDY